MIPYAETAEEIVERAAIADTVLAYANGIDRRDWALYREVFADTVFIDFRSWGDFHKEMPADEWVAYVRGNESGFDATHHVITNHVIAIDGERATFAAHMSALHYLRDAEGEGPEIQELGGFYEHRLMKTDGRWRIEHCKLVITWEKGRRELFAIAHDRFLHAETGA